MLHVRKVVSSAFLASEVRVTGAIYGIADEIPVATSGITAGVSYSHAP